ncbi:M23 family metallopeptidase [Aestuariispira insulae]|uniref:Peptidase M23-like protein n=1 Tax=Aestuariispira insulae TaxID=1461337 RepID=A0A3D9HWU7_9PROT|nr:M23 family metallopeptidase [Aestuariispira insulae]RED53983.1 peptidase M23-like protein [Aestuariispira insulae]
MKWMGVFLGLMLALGTARADDRTQLDGNFTQGGLVIGKTLPGTTIQFDGRQVRVSKNGDFIIGFHRDDPTAMALEIRYPDGSAETRPLSIVIRDYQIQRIDGLPPKKVTPPESLLKRIRAEAAKVRETRKIDRDTTWFLEGFIWPAKGRISGVYGSQRVLNGQPKQPHYGIDIAAPKGTPVLAPASGIVTLAEPDLYYSGGTILLDHGHGLASGFLHLDKVEVAVGQFVKKGERLGTVGSTGRSTGAHLDWRVNWFDKRIDASLLVPPMDAATN